MKRLLNPVGLDGSSINLSRLLPLNRPRPRSDWALLLWSVVVAGAYFGAGRLGLLASSEPGVSAVWPPAGIAVAAVLLGGWRLLPAVVVGGLAVALSTGEPVPGAILAALADTVEPLIAVALLKRVGLRGGLARTSGVIAFVGMAGVVAPAVAAVLGVLSLLVAGTVSAAQMPVAWRNWWIGDLSGVLVVGSAILVAARTWPVALRPLGPRVRSLAALTGMCVVVAVLSVLLLRNQGALPFLVLPLLFVLAFGYGRRGAVLGGLIISTVAVVLTARGHGPFHAGSLDTDLIRAQTFVCVGSVTALLVAAAQNERRLAERAAEQLAASESALAEAQELAHIGSFESDLVSGRTMWSRELYRILGRDPGSISPGWRSWRTCVHEDDLTRLDQATRKAYAGRAPTSVVHRIVRPDGAVRTIEARFRFECDADERPARIVGTCQDITARKLAEERFRTLFEDAPYPIVVFDGSGEIVLSNVRAQVMFGLSDVELSGRQVEELVPRPAGAEFPWYETDDAVSGTPREMELRARRPDGEEFAVEVSLTPLVAEEGVLVSAAIRDVTELRAAAETLSYQARHDSLTGLPNRMLFLERLELALVRARHTGCPLAVVFLDLDDFKVVNDTRGHDVGDALLTALTPRLGAAVRHGDTIARLGGDEFVVLCEDLPDEAQALYIAERITDVSRQPLSVAGREHAVSISAGVVLVRSPEAVSAHGVLRDADAAMYAAKAGGKGRVAVFDESMRERMLERMAVEQSLRGARSRGELELFYQPVVALDDNRVVAVEALLRWQHPIRGLLAPSEFMAVAEATGLIADMGEWVIEEACRQATLWRDIAGLDRAVPVSVNISAYQLTRADLAGAVQRILRLTGLQPHLLILEVTEGALLEDMGAARRELARLKRLGVRLVLDDFGTGYSSLSALRELMIDGLKLDRSFVEALAEEDVADETAAEDDGGALVGAVLSLATALDAEVTAEGVETWSQVTRLRRHGCDYAQGFLFARPGPASDLTPMLVPAGVGGETVNASAVG